MKAIHMDTWSTREKLCLASAIAQEGDQDWPMISRLLQPFLEPHRPPDWFSERSCVLQYNALLEKVEIPRRKKRSVPVQADVKAESPAEIIKKKLSDERIEELKRLLQLEKEQYLKDKEEIVLINCGYLDDQLPAMWAEIQEEKRQKEHEAKLHAQWLKEREEKQKKLEGEQDWKPPVQSLQRRRKTQKAGRRRNSSQSSPGSEPDSTTVDSPLPDLLKMDVVREEPSDSQPKARVLTPITLVTSTPTPSSPLLTSLLKSPSPAPSSQASSILHSAITAQRGASQTIVSLLSSAPGSVPPPPTTVSPSLKNLVSSAIANGSEEPVKPQNTSPSAGAPTLSMLLELPPSLPGKPLPELPSVARQVAPPQLQTPPQPPPPPPPPPVAPPPLLPPAHPSTTPGQEVPRKDQETVKENCDSGEVEEVNVVEDLKEAVQCDALTDEAVLEMVLASEDSVCTEPATVPVASEAVDIKPHGSWVRALDFDTEVKKQHGEEDNVKLEKEETGAIIVTTQEQVIAKAQKETDAEKIVKDQSETAENDLQQENGEIIFEVISTENEKGDDGEVGNEIEVASKNEQDSSENYAESAPEQSGVVVTDITQEVFNIEEVEVPMSETVAEEVEIAGDESQSDLLSPELGEISEQQVVEVIVGHSPSGTNQDLAVEISEKHASAKDNAVNEEKEDVTGIKTTEVAVNAEVSKKIQENIVGRVETTQQAGSTKTKRELGSENSEVKGEGNKKVSDLEVDERKKQGDKQRTDEEKLRSKKKKHSKGKKKKHSKEKRSDSKNRSKETDSKPESKSTEKKEVQNPLNEPKEKDKRDGKEGVKKKDENTEKEIQKKEIAREEKKTSTKEASPEQVRAPKEGNKKLSESIQKDKSVKENVKQSENVNVVDKKKKELAKEIRPSYKETDSSKDVHISKESSKKEKEKGTMLDKQHRGHRKEQDVKNDDLPAKEVIPRKEKKEVVRRDSNKDTAHKKADKSDRNSDSEGHLGPGFWKESSIGSVPPTDEEDEKPLAEIVDEKKLQLVSNILTKEEKQTRSVEPQSGEEDKTSDAEPSKVVSKKQRAAAATGTPIDSVPNSPAPSFTTDEEKEHKAWKKAIMLLYNRLATHKYASLFLRPITNDVAPGYSSYIYKPVDLQMIKKNIEMGAIRTTMEFQKEVMRMFKNAIMYNKSLHDVHLMALEMQEECLQHIEEFVATQMLAASVGETPSRRETRTMDANKQKEFLRSPRASNQDDFELVKPSKRKRNDTYSDAADHTPKRKTAED